MRYGGVANDDMVMAVGYLAALRKATRWRPRSAADAPNPT